MNCKIIYYTIALLFITEFSWSDSNPLRSLNPSKETAVESKALIQKKSNFKKILNISNLKARDLMEPQIQSDIISLDPVAEILKEERKYKQLDSKAKDEYLREKNEKIKDFFEKKRIEKFLSFDFTKNVKGLSSDSPEYINRHLPRSVDLQQYIKVAFDAASRGDITTLRALLGSKVNINVLDQTGKNLLIYAVKNNQVDMVRFLIAQGIDINHQDRNNYSAISYAAKGKNSVLYDLLLKFGATINR